MPASERHWLGAVFFDPAAAILPALVRELREPLRYLSVPLVVVTAQEDPELQKQIHAAGAELIYAPSTPDALILKELSACCRVQPVTPELRAELLEPLITGVRQTLREMAKTEVVVRAVYQRENVVALGDVSAALALSHSLEGALILSLSMKTAEALARRILADAAAELDPTLIKDCMGEVVNIIAGQAKALLAGTPNHFVFSTPTVTVGQHGMKVPDNMSSLVIAFHSDHGAFALQLCRIR